MLSQFALELFSFVFNALQVTKVCVAVDLVLFTIPTLNSVSLFHLGNSVFLQLFKILTYMPSHDASIPHSLQSLLEFDQILLDLLSLSSKLFMPHLYFPSLLSLCATFWVISSDLFSKALILSSSLYNVLVYTFQNLPTFYSLRLSVLPLGFLYPLLTFRSSHTRLLHCLWQDVLSYQKPICHNCWLSHMVVLL